MAELQLDIPSGRSGHASLPWPPGGTVRWTSSDPAVVGLRPSTTGRHCYLDALGPPGSTCRVRVLAEGYDCTLLVTVTEEVVGYGRLKLVGRDIPAAEGPSHA